MKSRIAISVDEESRPIIKIVHEDSEDVRDLLVKSFLQNAQAGLLHIQYIQPIGEAPNKHIHLIPISALDIVSTPNDPIVEYIANNKKISLE